LGRSIVLITKAAMEAEGSLGGDGSSALLPLPSKLPTGLQLSISRLLLDGVTSTSSSASSTGPLDDSLSLTTQLSHYFPSAKDLTQTAIEKRQALLRLELVEQERYIDGLYAKLVKNLQSSGIEGATTTSPASTYSEDVEKKVEELLSQLATIREKARQSEEVVRDITRDIRMLDTCKRNVVTSMTALKRLQMLGT
jgi:hypothetical protein